MDVGPLLAIGRAIASEMAERSVSTATQPWRIGGAVIGAAALVGALLTSGFSRWMLVVVGLLGLAVLGIASILVWLSGVALRRAGGPRRAAILEVWSSWDDDLPPLPLGLSEESSARRALSAARVLRNPDGARDDFEEFAGALIAKAPALADRLRVAAQEP